MTSTTEAGPIARHAVSRVRAIPAGAFVLRIERNGLDFQPGQYISIGPTDDVNMREYSVYSPAEAPYLEVLVKEIETGAVSRRLRRLTPADSVTVHGPFGFFVIEPAQRTRKFVFIATGTGISPFHSFVMSYPELDYRVIHGVRHKYELYGHEVFSTERVVSCLTRDTTGTYHGRVTSYLRNSPIDTDALYYLCGNCDMIYEVFDILKDAGVPPENLFAEVYF